jgi:mannose-6-phosphate isomerase-like protein (cupin superfamily)
VNAGDEIFNPVTGHRLQCVRIDSELLELDSRWERSGSPPPEHLHPRQSEHFEVLEGALAVRIDGAERALVPGDRLDIPPGSPHAMWNPGPAPARAIWRTSPALQTAAFLEEIWELSAKRDGFPLLLERMRIAKRYRQEFRVTSPPWPLMRVAFVFVRRGAYDPAREGAVDRSGDRDLGGPAGRRSQRSRR